MTTLAEMLMGKVVPPDGEVVERGAFLPLGTYRRPDGTETTSLAFPQAARDGLDALAYALGYRQDPQAPAGYVTQDALNRGGQGLAESAMVGSLAARAPAGALRAGAARGAGELDPSQAARMARAREMGFGDEVWYHGTPQSDFTRFDLNRSGSAHPGSIDIDERAIFLTNKPSGADEFAGRRYIAENNIPDDQMKKLYADLQAAEANVRNPTMAEMKAAGVKDAYEMDLYTNKFRAEAQRKADAIRDQITRAKSVVEVYPDGAGVMPVRTTENYNVVDMGGRGYSPELVADYLQQAKAEGRDSVVFENMRDGSFYGTGQIQDVIAVLDPSKIRSVNAMFDPAKSDSANLLAANPMAGAVPLMFDDSDQRRQMIARHLMQGGA